MATDLDHIVRMLTTFYDFSDKTVVAVGAGGGQLLGYAEKARRVVAVDEDHARLEQLWVRAIHLGLTRKLTLVSGDILAVSPRGDVVLFEFCLHELPDPERGLAHARQLASDVLVIDHAPGSPWSWCAAEERGVVAAWDAVGRTTRHQIDVEAFQSFADYAELEAKLARQGPESRARIGGYRGKINISIPMPYRLALI